MVVLTRTHTRTRGSSSCFILVTVIIHHQANSDRYLARTQGIERELDVINPISHLQSLISEVTVFQHWKLEK